MPDAAEKTAIGVIVALIFVAIAVLGVGIWGFIQIVQWLTSK
jgi:hypothetical protein